MEETATMNFVKLNDVVTTKTEDIDLSVVQDTKTSKYPMHLAAIFSGSVRTSAPSISDCKVRALKYITRQIDHFQYSYPTHINAKQ